MWKRSQFRALWPPCSSGRAWRSLGSVKVLRAYLLLGFFLLTCFDTTAQVGLKVAAESISPARLGAAWLGLVFLEPGVYLAIGCYLGAFATWIRLLRHVPVGVAFAASHLEIVSVLIVSYLWLGESVSLAQAAGAFLILLGVGVLACFERRPTPPKAIGSADCEKA